MGDYSYVEAGCRITGTRIGKYCSIAPNVTIGLASHPLGKAASTHPRFFRDAPELGYDLTNRELHTEYNETTIGHDVWVGANAVIKDGVTVGNGAVIGAGAVVVRDVGPYAIVGGVPAKVIRQRFDDSTVERLQHLAWWDQDDEWLRRHLDKMLDVTQLIELSDAASAASLDHQA
ncbi:MAG: CatB-related O-acetyltransferase [Planctomycetota bacterium]